MRLSSICVLYFFTACSIFLLYLDDISTNQQTFFVNFSTCEPLMHMIKSHFLKISECFYCFRQYKNMHKYVFVGRNTQQSWLIKRVYMPILNEEWVTLIACRCPEYVWIHLLPLYTSQILTLESMPPDRMRWADLGNHLMQLIPFVWPFHSWIWNREQSRLNHAQKLIKWGYSILYEFNI